MRRKAVNWRRQPCLALRGKNAVVADNAQQKPGLPERAL